MDFHGSQYGYILILVEDHPSRGGYLSAGLISLTCWIVRGYGNIQGCTCLKIFTVNCIIFLTLCYERYFVVTNWKDDKLSSFQRAADDTMGREFTVSLVRDEFPLTPRLKKT